MLNTVWCSFDSVSIWGEYIYYASKVKGQCQFDSRFEKGQKISKLLFFLKSVCVEEWMNVQAIVLFTLVMDCMCLFLGIMQCKRGNFRKMYGVFDCAQLTQPTWWRWKSMCSCKKTSRPWTLVRKCRSLSGMKGGLFRVEINHVIKTASDGLPERKSYGFARRRIWAARSGKTAWSVALGGPKTASPLHRNGSSAGEAALWSAEGYDHQWRPLPCTLRSEGQISHFCELERSAEGCYGLQHQLQHGEKTATRTEPAVTKACCPTSALRFSKSASPCLGPGALGMDTAAMGKSLILGWVQIHIILPRRPNAGVETSRGANRGRHGPRTQPVRRRVSDGVGWHESFHTDSPSRHWRHPQRGQVSGRNPCTHCNAITWWPSTKRHLPGWQRACASGMRCNQLPRESSGRQDGLASVLAGSQPNWTPLGRSWKTNPFQPSSSGHPGQAGWAPRDGVGGHPSGHHPHPCAVHASALPSVHPRPWRAHTVLTISATFQ